MIHTLQARLREREETYRKRKPCAAKINIDDNLKRLKASVCHLELGNGDI